MADHDAGSPAPVLGTPADYPARPPDKRRTWQTVLLILFAAVLVAAMGGWGYVMMTARPDTRATVFSFDPAADQVMVTFEAHRPEGRGMVCRLRALDARQAEVGARDVRVPAGEGDVRLTERLVTSARATTVSVQGCYLVH
ncbi:hypothetical protein Sru01_27910 [Sphaerisporangium rufum]|uniref:DUF4307 domain-containing protein n=1 Tax=Sphaerisporangium rufum TaxID=1381558 RepID=A0A919R1A8_9ACTN|nr:DUF4307 domain-containing protein [Sphaerisporangium rufum]GII77809.1 hypothetical protein Sru01_27910 [Sphaerisporangium rufum]